jgi:hypothetical protein
VADAKAPPARQGQRRESKGDKAMGSIVLPGQPGNPTSTIACNDAAKAAGTNNTHLLTLRALHREWGLPSNEQIRWLLDHGVSVDALQAEPCSIAATTVRFDVRFFINDLEGEKALIFRATDRDEVIDLVAWSPSSGKMGSFLGGAFCLGDQDQLFNPASWFASGGLNIYRSPLGWLRGNRRGIVIVDAQQTYAMLRHIPRLLVDDIAHGEQLKRWMRAPKPTSQILVTQQQELGSLSA